MALTHSVPIRKIRARQQAIDQNDSLGIDVIRSGKKAPAKKRYFHRAEVIRTSRIIRSPAESPPWMRAGANRPRRDRSCLAGSTAQAP